MKDLLIVEDDPTLGEGIRLALQAPELRPQLCRSLADAGDLLSRRSFDLLILDINLPDGNGLDLLRALRRESEIPVILLTANDLETDIVAGLELGADDYIVKPFEMLELLARVEAVLRRTRKSGTDFVFYGVRIDFESRTIEKDGQETECTPREYELLETLVKNRNIALSRERLLDLVWGYDYEGDIRTVDVHIQKLRKKLGLEDCIKTVYKLGYRLEIK